MFALTSTNFVNGIIGACFGLLIVGVLQVILMLWREGKLLESDRRLYTEMFGNMFSGIGAVDRHLRALHESVRDEQICNRSGMRLAHLYTMGLKGDAPNRDAAERPSLITALEANELARRGRLTQDTPEGEKLLPWYDAPSVVMTYFETQLELLEKTGGDTAPSGSDGVTIPQPDVGGVGDD